MHSLTLKLNFAYDALQVIRQACATTPKGIGVDLTSDLRRERCLNLRFSLHKLTPQLRELAKESQPLSLKAQHLLKHLEDL